MVFKKEMPAMQHALRPYATAGVALVGASIIAVTPLAVPSPKVEMRPVQLVDAWSDLLTDTTANLNSIVSNANLSDISSVFSALLTNPLGVIGALTNLDPTVTTDTSGLPITVGVELTPALEMGLAQLGAEGAELTAINDVLAQLSADPSNALNILYEGTASILNAGLNGADNVSLLGGIIDIPLFNGLLAPEQSLTVDLNLTDLINALGLGGISLSSLNLGDLLNQIGLGDLSLGDLFNDLGLSGKGLGDLLGDPSLSTLFSDLGLGNLDLGPLSLTSILSDLNLDSGVSLNSLTLDQVLTDFGINPTADVGLTGFLDQVGFSTLLGTGLGTELNNLGLLSGLLTDLNGLLGGVLGPLSGLLNPILGTIGLNTGDVVSLTNLESALNNDTVGSLLGGQTLNDSLSSILTALGVGDVTPSGLTIGTLLGDLGFSSQTSDLTLGGLLGDLGIDPNLGTLLNTVDLGTLLNDLGISDTLLTNLPSILDLGDLSNLNLGDLLGDLGLGDLANITVDPFGGLITELVDTVPAQILAAL
jgi:hypothetical protein